MHDDLRSRALADVTRPLRNLVGGQWVEPSGGVALDRRAPADGTPLGTVGESSPGDVDAAVAAALAASTGPWRTLGRRRRARLLHEIGACVRSHADELAAVIALENGKLLREASDGDMPDTADVFDYYAGWVDKVEGRTTAVEGDSWNLTLREPLGVCALLVPWNYPLLLAAWKIAPALAMGNTVVVKPSPATPFSLRRFCELVLDEVDLPPGVLNVVLGDAPTGEALVRHPDVAKVSFTGSTAVGRRVLRSVAETNLAPVSLELGGKSPNIVFDDVDDLEATIDRGFQLMFSQKGEKCSEPTRFLLQRGIHDEFVAGLVARAEAVVCGDPFDDRSTQGAQCTEAGVEHLLAAMADARADGATLLAGGGRDTTGTNASGLFVRPTIFSVTPSMRLARDEVFGPLLAVLPFADEEEAVAIANDSPYGLAAGVSTGDPTRARRVAAALDAAQVFVNGYGRYDFAAPFGGFKASGWGKEMGAESIDAYTRMKSVWLP